MENVIIIGLCLILLLLGVISSLVNRYVKKVKGSVPILSRLCEVGTWVVIVGNLCFVAYRDLFGG